MRTSGSGSDASILVHVGICQAQFNGTGMDSLLVERLRAAVPWLDALIPLSLLGFAWERNADPTVTVWILALWCTLKLVTRLPKTPLYGVLIGVLLVSLSALFNPNTISAPTDLVLVLLACAAGLQQTPRQWRIAFWCLLAIALVCLPFLEWGRFNGNLDLIPFAQLRDWLPPEAVRIQRITISRSAYLFGLFSLIGYSLWRFERRILLRWLAALLGMLSFVLAFATGSRAAFGYPLLAVLLTEVVWRYRSLVMRHARSLATALLVGGICFNVLLYWPSSPVQVDRSDVGRAEVARCFVARSLRSWHDFFGGQGYDRVSDRCADEVFLPGYTTGIPHAHNAFLQVLADQGVVAVLMMLVGLWAGFTRLFSNLDRAAPVLSFVGLSCWLFMFAAALVESTLLKTVLQQVVTGYLLAIPWWVASAPSPSDGSHTIGA
ncbi:O-antigen ligase family protein [bacterium]|nr:O-antigen ligase family protein [bacterium]